jgi:hypothetical protein
VLKSHQRELVRFFKNYYIDKDDPKLPECCELKPVSHLMKKFDPDNDVVDKRILYEITGRHAQWSLIPPYSQREVVNEKLVIDNLVTNQQQEEESDLEGSLVVS